MRIFLLSFLSLTLIGCGPTLTSSTATKLSAQGQNYTLEIPSDWQTLPPPEGVVFMAQKGDQNFVILERQAKQSDLKSQILQSAQQDFFSFEILEESSLSWAFKGQVRASLPTRIFEQKIYSKSDSLLLGSCSYETSKTSKSDCEKILKSWEVLEE